MYYQTPLTGRHTKDFSFKQRTSKQDDLNKIVSHRDKLYDSLIHQNEKQIELEKQHQTQILNRNSSSTNFKTNPQSPLGNNINRSLSQIEKNKDTIRQQISFLNSQIQNSQIDSQIGLSPQKAMSTLPFYPNSIEREDKNSMLQEKELQATKQLNDQAIHIKQLQLQNDALQKQLEQFNSANTSTTITKQLFPQPQQQQLQQEYGIATTATNKKKKKKTMSKNTSLNSYKSQSSLHTSTQSNIWKKQKEVVKISEEVKQKFKSRITQAKEAISILEKRNGDLENQIRDIRQDYEEKFQQYQQVDQQAEFYKRERDNLTNENEILIQENQKMVIDITGLKEEINLQLERKTQDIEKCAGAIQNLTEQLKEQQKLNEMKEIELDEQQKQIKILREDKEIQQQEIKNLIQEIQNNQTNGTMLNSQFLLQELSSLDTTFTQNLMNMKDQKQKDNNQIEKELLNIIKQLKNENDELTHNLQSKRQKFKIIQQEQDMERRHNIISQKQQQNLLQQQQLQLQQEQKEEARLKSMILNAQDKNTELRRKLQGEIDFQEKIRSQSPYQNKMARRY